MGKYISGSARNVLDENRRLFADLSKEWAFVHTTESERMEKVWKQVKNTRIFAP